MTNTTMAFKKSALILLMACGFGTTDAFQQSSSSSCSSLSLRTPSKLNADGLNDGGFALSEDLQLEMERRNQSRQKFGLEPLSAPQFMELQSQIADLEQEQLQLVKQSQQQSQQKQQQKQPVNPLKKLFQKGLEDQCYTNFDCESPKVCCDLGFKKMCCSSGMMEVQHQYSLAPVPVDMRE